MEALDKKSRLALALVLVVAAALRFYGLNWDLGQHAHPDERWIAMVAPTITWPQRVQNVLDPRRSTLNPLWLPDGRGGGQVRNFAYGHLPLYLQSLAGHALASWGRRLSQWEWGSGELAHELQTYGEYAAINITGRILSALSDLGTICLVFLLGKRIYGTRVGLLGAALVAFAVMHIQLSHFSTFDVITTFFIVLSVYGSVCVVQEKKSTWPTIWGGAAAGLAVASKFSAAPLVAVLVCAQLIRAMRRVDPQERHVVQVFRHAWPNILLSLWIALLAFFVSSPFAVLDVKSYFKQIAEQGAMVRGRIDWPFTRQYRYTTPFLYQIVQQVRWGLGWPLGITAFAGFCWVIVRQFRRPRAEELVLLGWTVPYFLMTGTFMVKFMRYMLPLLPLFILMGAAMLRWISAWANGQITNHRQKIGAQHPELETPNPSPATHSPRLASWDSFLDVRYLLSSLPYLVLIVSILYALAFMRVYAQEHPWIQASRWIYVNVPDGSTIAREHWDDDLPMSLPEPEANPAAHQYDMSGALKLPMYEPDKTEKYHQVRAILRTSDYVILATNRLYRSIPRLPKRYPISTDFYRLLFEGKLGYVREKEFTAYPGFLGLQIVDDDADESFTVYDHPKPIVFRKVRDLDDSEWDALFVRALATQPVWEFVEKPGLFSFLDRKPRPQEETERTLLLDQPVGELPVVADFGWNRWASESTVGAVVVWWLVVSVLGWLAWPLTFTLCSGLRDRGYVMSRSLALVVVGYLIWLPSSLHWLKNGLPLTYAAIGVLVLASGRLLWRNGTQIADFLRCRRGMVLIGEALFGVVFLLFVGIRILNPDLWQPWNGGEKLMDIAYLNACLRSAHLPPYDPYYSGGYLNYYYYGQFLVSILARLTGIKATVAFNLAVPTLFALTVCNAFSVGYTLAGKVRIGFARSRVSARSERSKRGAERTWFGVGHGLLAAVFVTVLGNLASATQIIERLGGVSQSAFTSRIPGLEAFVRAVSGLWQVVFHDVPFPGFNYWDPSRVVGLTINEFPYWSFLFADLHPHMINIPFTLLVIALALNWLLRKPDVVQPDLDAAQSVPSSEGALVRSSFLYLWRRLDWGAVLNWVLWPIALGTLAAVNTWDWPAYAGLCGLVLLFVFIRSRGKRGVVPALLAGGALAGVSILLYAPFFGMYSPLYVGFGWSLGRTHTELGEFFTVWGFFLFVAITLLLILLGTQRSRWAILRLVRLIGRHLPRLHRLEELYVLSVREARAGYRLSIAAVILVFAAMIWGAWKGYWVLTLMVPLLILAFALMVQREMSRERRFVLALLFTVFLLLVGIELFYLKDHLDGDQAGWWRMNTLFKFYMQVWVMLGVALGAALPEIWRAVERWGRRKSWLWTLAFALLFVAAALYPVLGTPARVIDRFPGERPPIGTLDGMAFMTVGTYHWPDANNPIHLREDYEAIRWLQANVRGTPVLAEAPIGYYREFGVRVSSYTGLPTLIGMHESEQRHGWQVGRRSAEARDLFITSDLQRTVDLLRELGVQYVYVGPLEQAEYPQARDKFEQLAFRRFLSIVYQNEQVTIYEVE
jgi:YYY domain-containing protein